MQNTELIAKCFRYEIKDKANILSTCSLCGKKIQYGIQNKYILSSTFSDYNYLKTDSDYLCEDCICCLKNKNLRINNFIADINKKIILFKKNEIEKYLFNLNKYFYTPFIFCVTKTFKKHMSFKAKINYNRDIFYIFFEDKNILFSLNEHENIYSILKKMYTIFTKEELLNLNFTNIKRIELFGWKGFRLYLEILKKYKKTHIYDFLVYILDSESKFNLLKKEGKNAEKN